MGKTQYMEKIETSIKALKAAVTKSEDLEIPQVFREQARPHGVSLKFIEAEKLKRREDKKATNDERQDDSGASEFKPSPSGEFSLVWLRSKKVVARIQEGGKDGGI